MTAFTLITIVSVESIDDLNRRLKDMQLGEGKQIREVRFIERSRITGMDHYQITFHITDEQMARNAIEEDLPEVQEDADRDTKEITPSS